MSLRVRPLSFPLLLLLVAAPSFVNGQTEPFTISGRALAATETANPTFFLGRASGLYRGEGSLSELEPVAIRPIGSPQPPVAQVFVDGNLVVVRAGNIDDVDEIWASSDTGATWTRAMTGLPEGIEFRELFLAPGPPASLFLFVVDGNDRLLYRSDDRAASWRLEATLPTNTSDFNVNLNTPSLMFATAGRSVRRSLDGGQTWLAVGTAPFPVDQFGGVAFIVSAPKSPMNVVLGGGGGGRSHRVYLSTDQGSNFEQVANSVARRLFYGADWPYMLHSASTGGTIDLSINNGVTWARVRIDDGLPSVQAALPDPRNDQIVYIDTSGGLYRSANNGFDWEQFQATVVPTLVGPGEPVTLEIAQNAPARSVSLGVRALEDGRWELPYTVEDPGASWLTLNRTSGVTRTSPLTAELNPAGLEVGEYRAEVKVRSDATFNPETTIEVVLRVGMPIAGGVATISTFAGNGGFGVDGDGGPALDAALGSVWDMAMGPDGSFYLTLWIDDVIRRIRPDGVIEPFAGTGVDGFSGDGGQALQAELSRPSDIAVGADGSVYFVDDGNRRVRKIDTAGRISTIAGNGEFGRPDNDAGPDASAVDMDADLVAVSETGLLVHAGSSVYRVAEDRSYALFAEGVFGGESDLQLGPRGELYLSRDLSDDVVIVQQGRRLDPVAGTGDEGYDGDGGPATSAALSSPSGLAISDDLLFIADTDNHVIRAVDASGVITTVVGIGGAGFSGDGGPARLAELDEPESLVYNEGKLYINDTDNRRIRVVDFSGGGENPQFSSAGVVNAASFAINEVAAAEIVSIFGQNLASATEIATSTPLPEKLAGVRVTITDSVGSTRACVLFFVTNGQINCYVDPATAAGAATLTIRNGGAQSSSPITVKATAPGLFAANANGQGVAAAVGIRVAAGGAQSSIDVFNANVNPRTPIPIDLGPEGEQVVLLLFGTGIRGWSNIEATIGGQSAQVIGVAEQGEFVGLDQINVIIPRSLIGAGEVEIRLTVDGVLANVVTISVQ